MKRICITVMNSDVVAQDSKQVIYLAKGYSIFLSGTWFPLMPEFFAFHHHTGCEREYFDANHQFLSNGQAGKGSTCCICVNYWWKIFILCSRGWYEASFLSVGCWLCICHMLSCLSHAEGTGMKLFPLNSWTFFQNVFSCLESSNWQCPCREICILLLGFNLF